MSDSQLFETLQSVSQESDLDQLLDTLADQLRVQQKYHELFEVLKMSVRRDLQLPVDYSGNSQELSEQQRQQLEDGLLAACQQVGSLLVRDGKLGEGWMYLRPVGDRQAVAVGLVDDRFSPDSGDIAERCLLFPELISYDLDCGSR